MSVNYYKKTLIHASETWCCDQLYSQTILMHPSYHAEHLQNLRLASLWRGNLNPGSKMNSKEYKVIKQLENYPLSRKLLLQQSIDLIILGTYF